jgi:hypothetical protein
MKIKKKIAWQKYEDIIESQLDSPLMDIFLQKLQQPLENDATEEEDEELIESALGLHQTQYLIPIDPKLAESINMAQSFDCWMAHTNFNITRKMKDALNKADGVEVLKICSRYRFFIGIGRMFDFKEVRKNIEKLFLEEGE